MPDPGFREAADRLGKVREQWLRIGKVLDVPVKKKDIAARESEAADPAFWADSTKAKAKSKELNALKKSVTDYEKLGRDIEDLETHIELAREADDLKELKEIQ